MSVVPLGPCSCGLVGFCRADEMALDAAQFLLRPEVQAQLAQELGTDFVFSEDSAWDAAQKILDRFRVYG